jgi:four helix bundle protein
MFDFQKLDVYHKSKKFCKEISLRISEMSFDKVTNDQLRRASFSIMLNIADGTSRLSNKDKKNYFVTARGSAFECVAIIDYLIDIKEITQEQFHNYTEKLEESQKCYLD